MTCCNSWFQVERRILPAQLMKITEKVMNLSHYESTDPDMNRGDRQKCLKAGGNALPPHHQKTILLLEPGKRPLGLELWHDFVDWSPTTFLGLPAPLGELCPYPTLVSLVPERFGIIAFLRRDDLQTFARPAAVTGVDLDHLK